MQGQSNGSEKNKSIISMVAKTNTKRNKKTLSNIHLECCFLGFLSIVLKVCIKVKGLNFGVFFCLFFFSSILLKQEEQPHLPRCQHKPPASSGCGENSAVNSGLSKTD